MRTEQKTWLGALYPKSGNSPVDVFYTYESNTNPLTYTVFIRPHRALDSETCKGFADYVKKNIFNEKILGPEREFVMDGRQPFRTEDGSFVIAAVNESLLNHVMLSVKPFVLPHSAGNNYALGITYGSDESELSCYIIHGRDHEGREKSIKLKYDGCIENCENKPLAQFSPIEKWLYQNREAIFQHFGFEFPQEHRPFSVRINDALSAIFSPEQLNFYRQHLTFRQQYLLLSLAIDYQLIQPQQDANDSSTWGPRNVLDWADQRHQPQDPQGIYNLLIRSCDGEPNANEKKKWIEHLVNTMTQSNNKTRLKSIFDNYMPEMMNISDLEVQIAVAKNQAKNVESTSATGGGQLGYYVEGPKVDAYAAASLLARQQSVVQVASQLNGLEFAEPNYINDAEALDGDPTQGPAVQKTAPELALARLRYFLMAVPRCEPQDDRPLNQDPSVQQAYALKLHDIFLRDFRRCVSSSDTAERLFFDQVYVLQNGYMHAHSNQEEKALQFAKDHAHTLLANIEVAIAARTGQLYTQVLCSGLARGDYDGPGFNKKSAPADWRSRGINHALDNTLALLDYQFLSTYYRISALLAVLQAIRSPQKRIPLVLTRVGGGVFGNEPGAVDAAIRDAIHVVQSHGVTNIDIVLSAYGESDVNHYLNRDAKNPFRVYDTQGHAVEFRQVGNGDFRTPDGSWEAPSFADAVEYQAWKIQQQQDEQQRREEQRRQLLLQQAQAAVVIPQPVVIPGAVVQQQPLSVVPTPSSQPPTAVAPQPDGIVTALQHGLGANKLPLVTQDSSRGPLTITNNAPSNPASFANVQLSVRQDSVNQSQYYLVTYQSRGTAGSARIYLLPDGNFRLTWGTDAGRGIDTEKSPIACSLQKIFEHFSVKLGLTSLYAIYVVKVEDDFLRIRFVSRRLSNIRITSDGEFQGEDTTIKNVINNAAFYVALFDSLPLSIEGHDQNKEQTLIGIFKAICTNNGNGVDSQNKARIAEYLIFDAFKKAYRGGTDAVRNARSLQDIITHANSGVAAASQPRGVFGVFNTLPGTESRNTLLEICYGKNSPAKPAANVTLTGDMLANALRSKLEAEKRASQTAAPARK